MPRKDSHIPSAETLREIAMRPSGKGCPGVLIAGTGSGVGKTSVTLGLIRALVRRGLRVQPFKVGPDYLDPTYLSLAAKRTCFNLDTWMCGKPYVQRLVSYKAKDANIFVVEGAMGLFDGAAPSSMEGSAAEIARLLDIPVVLVCDAGGQARSLAATVKGFATFEPGVEVKGVIANFCGSTGHVNLLKVALKSACAPSFLGGIEKGTLPGLQSRHLGLLPADESATTERTLESLADAVSSQISLNDLPTCASPVISYPPACSCSPLSSPSSATLRLGIAMDEAFRFYYRDNLCAFEDHGFALIPFSPLTEERLPHDVDALYFGGGYPELFADELSHNKSMIAAVRAFCLSGRPVYAECGGLMYLSEEIITLDGEHHEMARVLPAACKMQSRIRKLGYTEVELVRDCMWGAVGTRIRGHEFHYSELVSRTADLGEWDTAYNATYQRGERAVKEGFLLGNVLLSYIHLHLASHPTAVRHFRECCLGFSTQEGLDRVGI
jgi:cobyrinic acid a,c-diamide synthase